MRLPCLCVVCDICADKNVLLKHAFVMFSTSHYSNRGGWRRDQPACNVLLGMLPWGNINLKRGLCRKTQMTHKIILDCDPGHDDAIAILLAAHHPDIELLAITTVAGNQSVDKTTLNALKVCSLADIRTVPIARGSERPLVREARHAPNIHGESGMDGPQLPDPTIEPVP